MNTEGQLLQMGEREECLKGVGGKKKKGKKQKAGGGKGVVKTLVGFAWLD